MSLQHPAGIGVSRKLSSHRGLVTWVCAKPRVPVLGRVPWPCFSSVPLMSSPGCLLHGRGLTQSSHSSKPPNAVQLFHVAAAALEGDAEFVQTCVLICSGSNLKEKKEHQRAVSGLITC